MSKEESKKVSLSGAHSKTPKFSLKGQQHHAKCVSVYDADTMNVVFPHNGELTRWTIRLYGVNAAEIRGGTEETKKAGACARDWVRSQILDKEVWVKCYGFGKYGRLVADIYLNDSFEGPTLSDILLEKDMAIPFMRTEDKKYNLRSPIKKT